MNSDLHPFQLDFSPEVYSRAVFVDNQETTSGEIVDPRIFWGKEDLRRQLRNSNLHSIWRWKRGISRDEVGGFQPQDHEYALL